MEDIFILESLYLTVGCHPTRCDEFEKCSESYLRDLLSVAQEGMKERKIVAIGEFGLDYDRTEFCDKSTQLR